MSEKPLKRKAYGSIGHLPGSRLGPGDHHVHAGQAKICLEKPRDRHDFIIVTEKVDGSCVAAAKLPNGQVVALGRAGYLATTSPFEQHHLWADWVRKNYGRFDEALKPGERIVGEWLAQAHGTRYKLLHEPFVAFDLMVEDRRAPFGEFSDRIYDRFIVPWIVQMGSPLALADLLAYYEQVGSHHGALDPVEGGVWRVERNGKVDFLAKWVRPTKIDGSYLPELTGEEPVWNWRP